MAGRQQKSGKSKRPASERKKAAMARSRRRAEERHQAAGRAQAVREAANRALRAAGLPTPWETACAARAARRAGLARKP